MLDQQNGKVEFLADPGNEIHQITRLIRVHSGRRLIEQQQLGSGRERPGNLKAALVTIAQIAGYLLTLIGKIEYFEDIHRLLSDFVLSLEMLRQTEHRREQ